MSEAGSFERAVLRELDHIRGAFERTVERLERQDESRDSEVSDLKLQVSLLRSECKRNMKRDAGLVIAPTTLVTIISAVLNWTQAPAPPPLPRPAPPVSAAPSIPVGG